MWKRNELSEESASGKLSMQLGASMVVKGELSASEDLTLNGQMEGTVKVLEHTLTIGPNANLKTDIQAKVVRILGTITGNVVAREKVEIQQTGSVTGNVTAPKLAIVEGGYLRGKVEMPAARP